MQIMGTLPDRDRKRAIVWIIVRSQVKWRKDWGATVPEKKSRRVRFLRKNPFFKQIQTIFNKLIKSSTERGCKGPDCFPCLMDRVPSQDLDRMLVVKGKDWESCPVLVFKWKVTLEGEFYYYCEVWSLCLSHRTLSVLVIGWLLPAVHYLDWWRGHKTILSCNKSQYNPFVLDQIFLLLLFLSLLRLGHINICLDRLSWKFRRRDTGRKGVDGVLERITLRVESARP